MCKWKFLKNSASSLIRKAKKPIKNFNLESRVDRALDKEKRFVSPRHEGSARLEEPAPDLLRSSPELLARLKDVYITTPEELYGTPLPLKQAGRNLPTNRGNAPPQEYGYSEPMKPELGKVTLQQVLSFMSNRNQNKEDWPASRIAKEYKLDVNITESVLKYFNVFSLVVAPGVKGRNAISGRDHSGFDKLIGENPKIKYSNPSKFNRYTIETEEEESKEKKFWAQDVSMDEVVDVVKTQFREKTESLEDIKEKAFASAEVKPSPVTKNSVSNPDKTKT